MIRRPLYPIRVRIIEIKRPSDHIEQDAAKPAYVGGPWSNPIERVKHIAQAFFAGHRSHIYSGGATKRLSHGAQIPAQRLPAHSDCEL